MMLKEILFRLFEKIPERILTCELFSRVCNRIFDEDVIVDDKAEDSSSRYFTIYKFKHNEQFFLIFFYCNGIPHFNDLPVVFRIECEQKDDFPQKSIKYARIENVI